VLPGISTEQLRSRLNRMVADGMLTRKRYREVPPRVDYELTERARELMPILGELARWGYEWAWSPPREGEQIDIGAILRLTPGLIGSSARRSGTLELTVTDCNRTGGPAVYMVRLSDRGAVIEEREAPAAEVRLSGTETDWIKAFSPARDRSRLTIDGDEGLAGALLDGLAPAVTEHATASGAAAA
jgi:hypothetical protein